MTETEPGLSSKKSLPQPLDSSLAFTYIPYDSSGARFSGEASSFEKGQLVWTLKSKGRKKGNRERTGDGDAGCVRPPRLFCRARVVSDPPPDGDTERVLVRYPKGSTYRVKRKYLIPIFEKDVLRKRLVLAVAETSDYRRTAAVHTCVTDSFLEIGCDFGPCVDRVRNLLTEKDGVSMDAGETCANTLSLSADVDGYRVQCLGIDKAPESIKIAKNRFPGTCFSVEDALTEEGTAKLRALCGERLIGGFPSVVAVDINGDRPLPAVLQCLENIMNPGNDVVVGGGWELPRLIIVKSRTLFEEVTSTQRSLPGP